MPATRKATPILWRWWMTLIDTSLENRNMQDNNNNNLKNDENTSNGSGKGNNQETSQSKSNTSSHDVETGENSDNKEAGEASQNNEDWGSVSDSEGSDDSDSEMYEIKDTDWEKDLLNSVLNSAIILRSRMLSSSSLSSLNGGTWNSNEVVKLLEKELGITSKVKMEFNRFIDVFAEYESNIVSYNGYDTYNVKKLMLRKYEGKPPSHYKVSREKEKVVLIVDNSGSMSEWTSVLLVLTTFARMRRDVEIYTAPNGEIKSKWDERKKRWVPADSREVYRVAGRKIIYIGDFDGANLPVELSRKNTVVYICTENRYRYFNDHDWVYYDEEDFKGFFIRAWTIEEIIEGLKMIIKPNASKWIDFHEDHCYEGDECYNYEYEFEDDDSYDDDEDYYYDDDYDYSNNDDEDEYYYDDDE